MKCRKDVMYLRSALDIYLCTFLFFERKTDFVSSFVRKVFKQVLEIPSFQATLFPYHALVLCIGLLLQTHLRAVGWF